MMMRERGRGRRERHREREPTRYDGNDEKAAAGPPMSATLCGFTTHTHGRQSNVSLASMDFLEVITNG